MSNVPDNAAHTCSYSCDRPQCIKAQRDELAAAAAQEAVAWQVGDEFYPSESLAIEAIQQWGPSGAIAIPLYAAAPVTAAPDMESMGKRKLMQLQDNGFIVNGVAIYNPETGRRGLVDYLGYVGWVGSTPAAPGIDLTPFRELADAWQKESSEALGQFPPIEGNHRSQMIRLGKCATKLHNLIDASPKGATFHNDGNSEAQFIADEAHLNCPACGGSGHVEDSPKGGSRGRYFCGGPEGHFFCDDLKLARDLVNEYDKGDDWTITGLQASDAEARP